MKIDLSTAKTGDSVKLRSGETALINWIDKNSYDGFKIFLFMTDSRNDPRAFNDDWHRGGVVQFSDECDDDIIEIIKNNKDWTDEDMLNAFGHGASGEWDINNCEEWLNQYKQETQAKNGE